MWEKKFLEAEVVDNIKVGKDSFRIKISLSSFVLPNPGQFFMIRVVYAFDPLLPRPLSVHFLEDDRIHLLYRVVGRGTHLLSRFKRGDKIRVSGPFGNGFNIEIKEKKALLICGGMGFAPMLYLAKLLEERGKDVHLLWGAKEVWEFGDIDLIFSLFKPKNVTFFTEDGSFGEKGRVLDGISRYLKERDCHLFLCGSKEMLNEAIPILKEKKAVFQVSLEAHMACGFGVCYGCRTEFFGKNILVCKDGPVFMLDFSDGKS